ncbi:hypothetical protein V1277_004216 [Bradyrhizobium sp. AZCC 1588]|uniref:hypothetical protein n=1 Tax=unclassified Bradyrhizobium TaxID=2631580 RepID=UPI002FF26E6B
MRSRRLVGGLVAFGVLVVWLYTFRQRLPYMDQIPVFDADVTTAAASMWARIWWDEGARHLLFATPRAPLSIETPTMELRGIYDSWPPGAFVIVYLAAKFLSIQPSIPLINWINVIMHGLIALSAALAVYNLALMNRLGSVASGLLALGVAFPILLSRGLIYAFSQIYDVVTAVLIFTAIFLLLEVLYYGARSRRDQWVITALQLTTIYLAFFVDWLSYTLFIFWLVSRFVAGYAGVLERMNLRRFFGLLLLPFSAFSIFLAWRFLAPGAMSASASIKHLFYKILQRMNMTADSPITGFAKAFFEEMHQDYYSQFAFPLIAVSTLVTLGLLITAFRRARDPFERRSIFATMSVLLLITVPFYLHMLVIYQHTFIHRWAISKALFAYSMVPFALLPIAAFILVRQSIGESSDPSRRSGLAVMGLLLAGPALYYAVDVTDYQSYALRGRVDRDAYLMWSDIGRNTAYKDVVVSPVLQADPISVHVGTAFKLVHHADNFDDVDKVVARVCGDFNVVLALPKGSEPGVFASREAAEVIDTGRIRLLRFASYPGKAIDCPG